MGDIVGVHEPFVIRAEELVKKALYEQGADIEIVGQEGIRVFATQAASLYDHAIDADEFSHLITTNARARDAWSILLACG